jgi:DeoD family purine-nucleoside phosphorylase
VPIHLQPTAPLAERVLLPGDPGRALLLAQTLLEAPAMFNHNRGLWGYTGQASDGQPLTVQSTGMGGPSAAVVISELAELGARRLLRVGTCGALADTLALGELLIVTEVLPDDGTSRGLGASGPLIPDPALLVALRSAAAGQVKADRVVSTDLFYDTPEGTEQRWIDAGAVAVEMETAALFALAARHDLQAASLLLVSDLVASGTRISQEALREGETRLGEVAARALATQEILRIDPNN